MAIAIDPGSSSGYIVYDSADGIIVKKMPSTIADILEAIRDARFGGGTETQNLYCVIEDVGVAMPGNAAKSSRTFATHMGHLEMALLACGVSQVKVRATEWQKLFRPLPKGEANKAARKNAIRDKVQRLYPTLEIPKEAGDAVGLYHYGKEWLHARKATNDATA